MGSSKVEIAASSPFGCVRREQNGCREQNFHVSTKSKSNFQRNLKELVRDHLHSCISISPKSSNSMSNENVNQHQANGFSCWGCGNAKNRDHDVEKKPVSSMSRRQPRVLERWGSQQAWETVSKIEKKTHDTMPVPSTASSPPASDCSCDSLSDRSSVDLRVASLVQKWRGYERLNQNNQNPNPNHTNGVVGSRGSSVSATSVENASSVEACETTTTTGDEKVESHPHFNSESESESVGSWESDRTTVTSDRISSASRGGDKGQVDQEGERERMRVMDIIRKWTRVTQAKSLTASSEIEHEPRQPVVLPQMARQRMGLEQNGDGKGVYPVVCSPRLRGRQAIADLFMRMEKERCKELDGLAARQAVTRFSQRGRIQAMLRLRFLRHDTFPEDHWRLLPRTCGSNRSQYKSFNSNLRERSVEASESCNANQESLLREIPECNRDIEKASTSNQSTKESKHREQTNREKINDMTETHQVETQHEEIHQDKTDHEETNHEDMKHDVVTDHNEASDEKSNHEDLSSQEQTLEQPSNSNSVEYSQLPAPEDLQAENIPSSDAISQDTCTQARNFSKESSTCIETSYNDDWEEDLIYEEEEGNDELYVEPNLDWMNDISRPRSYWEDLRQAWYDEISQSTSSNEEIRLLIERRSVSNALTSAFRQRMDQLLISCSRRRIDVSENEEEADQSMEAFLQEHMESLGIQEDQQYELQLDGQEREEQERQVLEELERGDEGDEEHIEEQRGDEDDGEHEQEEDEGQTPNPESYRDDVGDYIHPTLSSSQMPWSHYHEDSDDSGNIESTPFRRSSIINSDHDTHDGSSAKNISSIEMELIHDLRSQMKQLYREMSELRKSLKCCMDMRVMMQNSIREEISAALKHPDREEKKAGSKKTRKKKGNCTICHENKIDSLLYRCGHMCTCVKCAHELKWSSRKCPVCRAEIVDVVRAFDLDT